MFQELWSIGLQWDDKLPEDIIYQWRLWKVERLNVSVIAFHSKLPQTFAFAFGQLIKIRRCFTVNSDAIERVEIDRFGDASLKAYGVAVYIRTVNTKGNSNTKLVMSKIRVA